MIHTTLNLLREKEACEDGYKKVLKFVGVNFDKDKLIPLTDILKSNDIEETLWVIDNRATVEDSYKFQIAFGTWCAREVLEYWKDEFPDDNTIENCLDVRDGFVNGDKSKEEMTSAWESAKVSAWASAMESARASARASALELAWESARASAWASTWESARASAWASARASAMESARASQEKQLIKMLNEFEV